MKQVPFKKLIPLINEALANGKTITIPVTGVSMTPTLSPRDAVTLDAVDVDTVERGDIVLYLRKNGMYVLHRVVKTHKDSFDICGDAQYTIEKNVPKSAVIARVCSYEKNGKQYALPDIRKIGKKRLRGRIFRRAAAVMDRRFGKEEKNPLLTPHTFVGTYIKRHLKGVILLCGLSGVTAGATLGMALVSGRVIDKVMDSTQRNHFAGWFGLLVLLLVVVVVSNFVFSNLRARLMAGIKNEIRDDLFDQLLGKRFRDVQAMHSGEIINRFTSDVYIVAENVVSLIPQIFSLSIKLFGGLAFMLTVDSVFTSFLLIGALVIGVLLHFFSGFYKRLHKECQEAEGKSRSFLQECVENLIVVKSFNNEKGVLNKFADYQEDAYHKQVRRSVMSSIGNSVIYSGFTLAYYGALAWGIMRMAGWFGPEAANLTLGTFVSLLQVVEQTRTPFRSASGLLPQYYSMLASAERLQELVLLRDEKRVELPLSAQEIYEQMLSVGLDAVTFAYQAEAPVFLNKSLSFKKGQLTAIVGPSGSGKTTLIKLLLGLISPQDGVVKITLTDGSILPINVSMRTLFSYVPQGNMILSGTIEDNICFGNDDVTEEEVNRALRLACLEETVNALPDGIRTEIGERGIGLSEGQIQRLAVARALLSRSPILLLDECTSALDVQTERRLIDNLKGLSDHTILFISHRTAVLDNADAVVAIENLKTD